MKNFYDKILLAVAVILLILALAFTFMGSGTKPESNLGNQQPTGADFTVIEVPDASIIGDTEWPEPLFVDDNPLRIYQVFTPPKIYWDPIAKELSWVAIDIDPPLPPPPFGVELVSLERELFRVQFEAYFVKEGEGFDNDVLLIYNHELGEAVRGTVGQEFPEHEFKIVSFDIERVVKETEDSIEIFRYPTVVIEDLREDGKQITLTTAERLYVPDKYNINMRAVDPYPEEAFSWHGKDETKKLGEDTFTLLDFNFDNQTVTVEKDSFPTEEFPEPELITKILSPVAEPQKIESTENIEANPSTSDTDLSDELKNLFN